MQVKELMSRNPVCCLPSDSLRQAARVMVERDCGAVPIVENPETQRPLAGIVTDRDIVCRAVVEGRNPDETRLADVLSRPVISVHEDTSVEDAVEVMEHNKIRRIPVLDDDGSCVGILTQAHIAQRLPDAKSGELLRKVTEKTDSASSVAAH